MDDLIGKVLTGEATAEEVKRVQEWSSSLPENQKYFEQLQTIFNNAGGESLQIPFDSDAAWQKIKSKLSPGKSNQYFLILRPTMVRIAAILIVALGIGIIAFQWFSPASQQMNIVSDKSTVRDTLPDGTAAFLNKHSSLVFEYSPKEKIRRVKLSGESFFEVTHSVEKPLVIEAQQVFIRDLGTSFNVRAYPLSDTVEVMVQHGEVQVYTAINDGLLLVAGESAVYSKRRKEFFRLERPDTNVLAYKTGILSFHHTYLKSIIEKINDLYGAKIRLENPALGSCKLTVNFSGDSLETITEVIAETLNLKITRREDEILLSGPGCN